MPTLFQKLIDYAFGTHRDVPIDDDLEISPGPPPPPSASEMSIAQFIGLCIFVYMFVYFFIYVFGWVFLVKYVFLQGLLPIAINYFDGSYISLIIEFLSMAVIILPAIFIAFPTSGRISLFTIQSFLAIPINNQNIIPDFVILSGLFEFIFSFIYSITLLVPLAILQCLLKTVNHIYQNPSCLLYILRWNHTIWTIIQYYLDPYAYILLYDLPEKFAYEVLGLLLEPWRATQFLAGIVCNILVLIAIIATEVGKSVLWISQMLMRMSGAGHWMGTLQNRQEGMLGGVLLFVGYFVLELRVGLVISFVTNIVVSALLSVYIRV